MSHLTDETRAESVDKLRQAADLLEQGQEKEAGRLILSGLKPVAADLRKTYGPFVRLAVRGWMTQVFGD